MNDSFDKAWKITKEGPGTYEVALAQTVFWLMTVEAESPEHAEELAKDNAGMDQVSEGGKLHVDSVERIK